MQRHRRALNVNTGHSNDSLALVSKSCAQPVGAHDIPTAVGGALCVLKGRMKLPDLSVPHVIKRRRLSHDEIVRLMRMVQKVRAVKSSNAVKRVLQFARLGSQTEQRAFWWSTDLNLASSFPW